MEFYWSYENKTKNQAWRRLTLNKVNCLLRTEGDYWDDPSMRINSIQFYFLHFRENLCLNEECLTLGIAQTGSMCSSNAYTVVQDIGLSSGYHIAHEIGHLYVAYNSLFRKTKFCLVNGSSTVNFFISQFGCVTWQPSRMFAISKQWSDTSHGFGIAYRNRHVVVVTLFTPFYNRVSRVSYLNIWTAYSI